MGRNSEFGAGGYLSDDQFGGRFQIRPQEVVGTAVTHTGETTSSGLPRFMIEDASDAGEYCGHACAERAVSAPDFMYNRAPLREMRGVERFEREQVSPGDWNILNGRQFQTESLEDDPFFFETEGNTKHIVAVRDIQGSDEVPLAGETRHRMDTHDLADLAQRSCSGPSCDNPLIPGGAPQGWQSRTGRKPWLN